MVAFGGAVLTGGQSRRMGCDKALLTIDGRPMALIAAAALRDAGAGEVVAVGGNQAGLEAMGLRWVADGGRGPLDGLVAALAGSTSEVVVVLACDLPRVTADAVRAVVAAIDDREVDAAVPVVDGVDQVLLAAYRRASVLPIAEQALAAGQRAPKAVLDDLRIRRIELADPGWADNANRPEDLPS